VSSTVQKVLPVYLLSMLQRGLLIWVVLARALAGAIGSIGQLRLKKLFAYSSIFSRA
jgi:NADH:ubiquinone oxidoreductase subunit 2 (subunit N)